MVVFGNDKYVSLGKYKASIESACVLTFKSALVRLYKENPRQIIVMLFPTGTNEVVLHAGGVTLTKTQCIKKSE